MLNGAQARREETIVPSLNLNEEELLKILHDDPDREFNEALLTDIVRPLINMMRQLVRENPEQAKKGIRVAIELKNQDSPDVEWLSTKEVADMFDVSQQQVRRWCESARIRGERTPGGTWKIANSQFDGIGFVVPQGRKKSKSVSEIAGVLEGNEEALRELREGRD